MSIYIDADARDRTSTGTTSYKSTISYKPTDVRTIQLVELTDECIEKIVNKITDVKPVVRAKNLSRDGFLCSECDFGDFGGFHGYEPKYCPNCGIKMERNKKE